MTRVDCAAPSTTWSATVTPYSDQFGAGPGQATVEAKSCDVYCVYGSYYASAVSEVKFNAGSQLGVRRLAPG